MNFFVLEMVFFTSITVILYLLIRKLPVIGDYVDQNQNTAPKVSLKIKSEWIETIDKKTSHATAKLLRRIKLALMKMDAVVSRNLEKVKGRNSDQEASKAVIEELRVDEEVKKEEDKDGAADL